jgi:ferrochelatase
VTVQRAVLLVSHGTFDDLGDLPAFLTNLRRGQPPGPDLVAELTRRYAAIGGCSPLNATSALLARKLTENLGVPVHWANRLWKPYVRDVLSAMAAEGANRVALVPLAQHSAYVYADDARQAAGGTGLDLVCAPNWGQSPKLQEAFAKRIAGALADGATSRDTTVVMTAHSLPKAVIARGDPYEDEVRSAAGAIAAALSKRTGRDVPHTVAFQSQGMASTGHDGKPIEWLGPDLRTALDDVARSGRRRVVFAPIGFLADHVEVLYDLDIEARGLAEERQMQFARAASLNADDDLVEVLADVARPLLDHG